MKKKLVLLSFSFCLLAAACGGKKEAGDEKPKAPAQSVQQEEPAGEQEKKEEQKKDAKKKQEQERQESAAGQPEQEIATEEPGTELSKAPEVSFIDYSQDIQNEAGDVLLLSVTENCPVISIPENQAAAEKMNMVFEQQHTANQTYIQEDAEEARKAYKALSEEERNSWNGYGTGISYKVAYASTRILSIEAENYKWQGGAHPNTWTSSYCFDVTTGTLLYLSDILTDKAEAGKIVEKHILDTITKEPYKDALMSDYESYVSDILTENVFYLNDKGLVVLCNPDMLTVYAAGTIEIVVPYAELKPVMNPNYVL